MLESVKTTLLKLLPHPENKGVVVAVSGGIDSMVCLDVLDTLHKELNFRLTVAHVNHHLREDSDQDQKLLIRECESRALDLKSADIDEKPTIGESVEAWAREQRYKALESIRRDVKANVIVTAHHADDQVETLLLRLQSGTGASGLSGIAEYRGHIIRPLLAVTRSDIEAYAKDHRIHYREDSTNQDESIPRNYLRHRVIAPWKKIMPALPEQIRQTVQAFREMDQGLKYMIEQYVLPVVARKEGINWILNGASFDLLPEYLRIRTIQILDHSDPNWRRKDWNSLKQTLQARRTGLLHPLPGGSLLLRNREQWILRVMPLPTKFNVSVKPGSHVELPNGVFIWKPLKEGNGLHSDSHIETVDEDQLKKCQELVLRHWEYGDWIRPLGMKGRKKISDLLTDLKLDRFSKAEQVVLAEGREVLWVCGHRISERIKLRPDTQNQAELLYQDRVTIQ